MEGRKRIWVDSRLNQMTDNQALRTIASFNIEREENGEMLTLVTDSTFLDIKVFQSMQPWAEQLLNNGTLIIEIWETPDEMVRRPFFWTSFGIQTPECESIEEAIKYLVQNNGGTVRAMARMVRQYGLPKGTWVQGPGPEPMRLHCCTHMLTNDGSIFKL